MKLEAIIVDLSQNLIKIDAYKDLEVSIVIITRDFSINVIVYNNKKITIFLYYNVVISITKPRKKLSLSKNRDFIFKSQTLNYLFAYAHIVNYTVSAIFVRNNSKKLIILLRNQKLKKLIDYNVAANCFFIQLKNYNLAIKASKR